MQPCVRPIRACPQLEDSQADYSVIHRASADSQLTDAPLWASGRPMGQDRGCIAGPEGSRRSDRQEQSAVCGGGTLSISRRDTVARPSGAFWRPDQGSHPIFALAKSGVWKKLFGMLAADADNEYAMIDSTIVRAHQHSAGAQKKTAKTRRSGAAKAD